MSFKMCPTGRASRSPKRDGFGLLRWTLLLGMFTIIPGADARAADLTFDQIQVFVTGFKILAKQAVSVVCLPRDSNNNFISMMPDTSALPHPYQGWMDADGNFSGTLAYGVNFMNPNDASKAKTFKCSLWLSLWGASRAAEVGDGSQWWHVKSGNLTAEGAIP